jgi:hypothetical protein
MRRQAWREGAQVHLRSRGRSSFSSSSLLDAELSDTDEGRTVSAKPVFLEAPATHRSLRCLVRLQGVTRFPGECGNIRAPRFGRLRDTRRRCKFRDINAMEGESADRLETVSSAGVFSQSRAVQALGCRIKAAGSNGRSWQLIWEATVAISAPGNGSKRPGRERNREADGQGAEFDVAGIVAPPSQTAPDEGPTVLAGCTPVNKLFLCAMPAAEPNRSP